MKGLTHFSKAAVLGLFLGSLVLQNATLYARNAQNVEQMTIDEISNYFSSHWQDRYTLSSQIFNKAEKEPEFRKQLIETLIKRFAEETNNVRSAFLTRAFSSLNAREVLPQLRKKWIEIEKKIYAMEGSELRIQLLLTIAKLLPEDEGIEFLIKTESDATEAPVARFRATILLCATGNKKAIEHVLAVYEKAKKEFPAAMVGNNVSLKKTPTDSDGDLISNADEIVLMLDPNNPDTDGDGLIDGNDRNPLCKLQEAKLSDDQEIAQFILYLLGKYYCLSLSNPSTFFSPFKCKMLIVDLTDDFEGMARPGLFASLSFTGIDGVILHLGSEQILKLRTVHDLLDTIRLHKYPDEQKDIKKFSLTEFNRHFNMTFKNYNGTWLPIDWESGGSS
ncbi:MAG: hypothetical protein JW787_01680 [Sedimentisphaerales bacterium]|nr:hypothetical protein [Sedimentisphaerales bacterium]